MGILRPIEVVVAWIMVQIHNLLTSLGMPAESGLGWALSIVGLTVVIRILLIPLFVRQINASRGMQLMQPEMKKVQAKYKGKSDQASKEAMSREMFALYREHGTNPFSSCLPILAQMPIFFALFRVLNNLDDVARGTHEPIGEITQQVAQQIEDSSFFGAFLSSTFLGSDGLSVKVICLVMIVVMSGATFYSQRMLMTKNMPEAAMESNPFIQQQKIMLYLFPVIFAVSGVSFPIGVLIYWLTSNLWTAGQQYYVIHRMPAPGSQAERELNERRARKGKPPITQGKRLKGGSGSAGATAVEPTQAEDEASAGGQRKQPKRKNRQRPPGPQPPARSTGHGSAGNSSDGSPPPAEDQSTNPPSARNQSSSKQARAKKQAKAHKQASVQKQPRAQTQSKSPSQSKSQNRRKKSRSNRPPAG